MSQTWKNPIRIVTAASLFDGHDAAINVIRRVLQDKGAEVIHLGHNRSVLEIVEAVLQEGAQGVCVSSYQGGHMEFFKYMKDLLRQAGADHVKIFGGGGGVIIHEEKRELESYGITQIFHPDDGRRLGLEGMIELIMRECDFALEERSLKALDSPLEGPFRDEPIPQTAMGLALSAVENGSDLGQAEARLKNFLRNDGGRQRRGIERERRSRGPAFRRGAPPAGGSGGGLGGRAGAPGRDAVGRGGGARDDLPVDGDAAQPRRHPDLPRARLACRRRAGCGAGVLVRGRECVAHPACGTGREPVLVAARVVFPDPCPGAPLMAGGGCLRVVRGTDHDRPRSGVVACALRPARISRVALVRRRRSICADARQCCAI